jgi:hypothetical protein
MNLFGDRKTCRFFSSLLFPSGTAVSPEGEAAKMRMHLLDFVVC